MKLIAFFLMMTMSVFAVQAQEEAVEAVQDEATELAEADVLTQDGKAEIKAEELPQAVIDAFKASEYANWAIDKVYQVEVEGGDPTYEIVVYNGEESATIAADAEGNMAKKEE
ncbi:MAG: hypothetical protein ACR2MX_07060 [Cyclobacteriaceae bacterium]